MERKTIIVLVACTNSAGLPCIVGTKLITTPEQVNEGVHYDLAKEICLEYRYGGNMVFFDETELPLYLKSALEQNQIQFLNKKLC